MATRRCPHCQALMEQECPVPTEYGAHLGMLCPTCGPSSMWLVVNAQGKTVAACTARRVYIGAQLQHALRSFFHRATA
jgi:hypothetical protein